MGLPKNYQTQSSYLERRLESLNDLNFYTIEYEVKFTKEFKKKLDESWDTGVDVITDLGVYAGGTQDGWKTCNKQFSALSDEVADKKIIEWLDIKVEQNVLSDYIVKSMETNTLYDVLKEKNL